MVIMVSLIVAAGVVLVAFGILNARRVVTDPGDYIASLDDVAPVSQFDDHLSEAFLRRTLGPLGTAVLDRIGRLTPVGRREQVRHQLLLAGVAGRIAAENFMAVQVLCALGGVTVGLAYLTLAGGSAKMRLLVLVLVSAAGVLAPRSWLSRTIEARKHAIFMDLPDVLDLLAISVEAGVGFEGALEIVCRHFTSALAVEFTRTLKEMELGLPRRQALQNLKHRTEVPELSNFILVLVQADALGMPISRVLHTQAAEMRNKRRAWAREKAAKLPVKILFPLVLFIFPAIFVVLLGPAATTFPHIFKS